MSAEPVAATTLDIMRISPILAILFAAGAAAWILSGQPRILSVLFGDEAAAEREVREPARAEPAEAPAPTRVRVATSLAEPHVVRLLLTGRTEADRTVALHALTGGRIEAVEAREGALVDEGAVIARIALDDRPERLARAEARVDHFQTAFDASAELTESGWRAATSNAEALANLRGARAELAAVELDIARTRIAAPFSGVLDSLDAEVGDVVSAGPGGAEPLGEVIDLDPVVVVAWVSERAVGQLRPGAVGHARLVTGEVVDGTVRYVSRVAEPKTRTYRIELEIPNPDYAIPAGMTTGLTLPLESVASHFISPSLLSLDEDGALGVKIVDSGDVVRFVPVTIVASEGGGLRVAGLPPEVTLITVGHAYVSPGETVIPVRADGAGAAGSS